jgi:histidinol-phosphate aminotransferase
MGRFDGLPIRDELKSFEPYGAPQLDVPVLLNVNENPYPASEDTVADIAAAVAVAARGMNRYPDREFMNLRADLAAYLARESGAQLAPEQIWAANGSNEVMLHILQAFGGPGRTALSFAPTYSMYPEYARDTNTAWVAGRRAEDFTLDRSKAIAAISRHRPSVVLLASPNNPTGTALPIDVTEAIVAQARALGSVVVVDEAYAECGVAPAVVPESRRGADDVEGVRDGRRPGRVPCREQAVRRRAADRPPAVPPVRGDPGRRAGRVAALRRAARPGRAAARRA